MSKNVKANPRMLDMVMSDQNWLGRLSYVESVIYNKKKNKKRERRSYFLVFFLLTFLIGLVSGILLYYMLHRVI